MKAKKRSFATHAGNQLVSCLLWKSCPITTLARTCLLAGITNGILQAGLLQLISSYVRTINRTLFAPANEQTINRTGKNFLENFHEQSSSLHVVRWEIYEISQGFAICLPCLFLVTRIRGLLTSSFLSIMCSQVWKTGFRHVPEKNEAVCVLCEKMGKTKAYKYNGPTSSLIYHLKHAHDLHKDAPAKKQRTLHSCALSPVYSHQILPEKSGISLGGLMF